MIVKPLVEEFLKQESNRTKQYLADMYTGICDEVVDFQYKWTIQFRRYLRAVKSHMEGR